MHISIVTVCLDNPFLERTIASVIDQSYPNYTHLIIDGGSKNPVTLDTIGKYRNTEKISILAEKDDGIYDAMNKGIQRSNGDYLIFLNAGDAFYSGESLQWFVNNYDNHDIVYGDLEFVNPESNFKVSFPDKLSFSFFMKSSLPHPACFINRTVFEKAGMYDTSMRVAADWAFFLKAIALHQASYKHIAFVISVFDHGGVSSQPQNQPLIEGEKNAFLKRYFPLFTDDYATYEKAEQKLNNFRNSRLRKYLSFVFSVLKFPEN
ncbi:glycosyltransferase family 2 protein [Mucilaginibacter corticis]|nr:glycosyltransferase family 2 protein [Mucilaginibacter corticis]